MSPEAPRWLREAGIRLMERIRRTDALSLLPRLLESQWRTAGELAEAGRRDLGRLGRFCLDEVPHWAGPLAAAGVDGSHPLDPESLAGLPLLRKDDVRRSGPDLHSRSFAAWQPRRKSTSGSTGEPLTYYLDRPSHTYQWAHLWRGWHQVGYRPGDRYATLSGGALVPERVDLKQRAYLALSGALHLPSYHLSEPVMARYRRLLERRRAAFLYGYPSAIELFARFVQSGREPVLPLRAVFTTSEALAPAARTRMEAAFACRVIDTYGCNDGGIYAYECERREGLHVGVESVHVEIVDEQGRRLPDGEPGLIVTTSLVNRAMPLLRYVTGDVGALSREPCPCGRGLPRLVRLQGRERDFVLTPAGRRVHGAFFNHFAPFYEADWLLRFQVYQPDRGTLVIRLQVDREPEAAERERILSGLRRGLGDMDYRLEIIQDLPSTRAGKFRVIISDVA